jgi:hypothetical protein
VGKVAGLAYLVPKPADQGYTATKEVETVANAIFVPVGLNCTETPVLFGKLAGSAYLVPNPEDQGKTLPYGLPACATPIAVPAGLKPTP